MTKLPAEHAVDKSQKVAVVMGGPSEEHAVSLRSGQGITEALRRRGWEASALVVPERVDTGQALAMVQHALQEMRAQIAFIALHGRFGEDGTIQQLCEDLHVAYTGSGPEASRLGMDKAASKKRFEQAGLAVAAWSVVDLDQPAARLAVESWPMPFVIKPVDSGSSFGVSLVCRLDDVEPALKLAAQYGRQALIETFVAGREITVGMLGEEPLPVVEIRPRHAFFDFAAKYTPGETDYLVPAPLPTPVARAAQHAALEAHHALGCRHLSRADFILDAHGVPVLLEVNTIPGFTPTSLLPKAAACAGMTYEELCERLVVMAQHSTPHAVSSS